MSVLSAKFKIIEWIIRVLCIVPAIFLIAFATALLVFVPLFWMYDSFTKNNITSDYTLFIGDIYILAIFIVAYAPYELACMICKINNL
jgi:hypothetical protein